MTPRGRRVVLALAVVALLLSLGRWGSQFLADRLWDATVSEAVASAGSRRALLSLELEVGVIFVAALWFTLHFIIAARAALPAAPAPDRDPPRLWPARLPRWILAVAGVVLGVLLGSGASAWLDEILLTIDGVHLGATDPLLGADLAVFLRDFPLWLHLQARAALLIGAALAAVVFFHLIGGTIRLVERRVWVSPRARAQLAILLALFALALGWRAALEPFRLAAGLRGPLLSSEFLLRTLVAEVEAVLGAIAAVVSFLWWLRVRGRFAALAWAVFGLTLLGARILPLHTEAATADDAWRAAARALDSIAWNLPGVEHQEIGHAARAAALIPSLWDPGVLAGAVRDSGELGGLSQASLVVQGGRTRSVWLAVRQPRSGPPELLALSDDLVSPSGGVLYWTASDSAPTPAPRAYRQLPMESVRPGAPDMITGVEGRGVDLGGWPKRVMLAWALQSRKAFSAPSGSRLAWRLDPATRLGVVAPFAEWEAPRPEMVGDVLVWTSEGYLTSRVFPSSIRQADRAGGVSMMRSSFLGLVDAITGSVRIFQRSEGDSLAAAWARISRPLIEPAGAIPPGILERLPYPRSLLRAQAAVLQDSAWRAGRLPKPSAADSAFPLASAPGGTEAVVPLLTDQLIEVKSLFRVRRTAAGDSIEILSLAPPRLESPASLIQRWGRFPFQQQLKDSIRAGGARLDSGSVRLALLKEGVVAYQPAWAIQPSGKAQLALVNVALVDSAEGQRVGAGRTLEEAWRNLHRLASPTAVGTGPEAVLERARYWMRIADSALKRQDLQEFGRALAYLRDLLEPPR